MQMIWTRAIRRSIPIEMWVGRSEVESSSLSSLASDVSDLRLSSKPWNADHTFRSVCTLSKRYLRQGTVPYWYAYHPQWDDFLGEAEDGFLVLGCMDLDIAFAIPVKKLREHLDELNTTMKPDGNPYWHVKIVEPQPKTYALQMPKSGKHLGLAEYTFNLTQ